MSQGQPLTLRIASALFEIEAGEPSRASRKVLWAICALFGLLLVWACFAQLDIVAVAQGRLVPQTYVKIVQPAEAGIIREIRVVDGQAVQEGEVLVRLDPTINSADTASTAHDLELQTLELRRIETELAGRPMVRDSEDDVYLFEQVQAKQLTHRRAFEDSLAQERAARDRALRELAAAQEVEEKLDSTLPSYRRSAEAYARLASQNLVGSLQAEERDREATEKAQDLEAQRANVAALAARIVEHDRRLEQLRSAYESDLNHARIETLATVNRLEQQAGKLQYQQGLLELKAPQAGIVKELATTTLGAVVQPGTVLMSIVPQDEPLLAEVQIENKDIGFVEPNQPVRVKLTAYPFQKYGMVEGVVKTVSADASIGSSSNTDEADNASQGGLAFKALVALNDQELLSQSSRFPLASGMQVSAEIMQGKRTVLEYLLSPVQRVMGEAGMER